MEPFSIWGFTLIAMAMGAAYVTLTKKGDCGCGAKSKNAPLKKAAGVVDVEKEKEIDSLIAEG